MQGQKKRSLTLFSHPTSVALEPVFWEVLEEVAKGRGCSLSALIAKVDSNRSTPKNLSSSLREFVVKELLERIKNLQGND